MSIINIMGQTPSRDKQFSNYVFNPIPYILEDKFIFLGDKHK